MFRGVSSFLALLLLLPLPAFAPSKQEKPNAARIAKAHEEFIRRVMQLAPGDVAGHLKLAKWCEEERIIFDARAQYERILSLNPDHAEARAALGWKKMNGAWQLDLRPMAESIKFNFDSNPGQSPSPQGHRTRLQEFLADRGHWINVLKTIHDRTGMYQIPDGLDFTVIVTSQISNDAPARTDFVGYETEGRRMEIRMLLNARLNDVICAGNETYIERIILHETVHALAASRMGGWPLWINEGLAAYTANDIHYLREAIDRPMPDLDKPFEVYAQSYASGQLFFRWLFDSYGEEKLKNVIDVLYLYGNRYDMVAEKVCGKPWKELKEEYSRYGEKAIDQFKKTYGIFAGGAPVIGILFDYSFTGGVKVFLPYPNSPAQQAGILPGDVIVGLNDIAIRGIKDAVDGINTRKSGETVTLKIQRGEKTIAINVPLVAEPSPKNIPPKFRTARQML